MTGPRPEGPLVGREREVSRLLSALSACDRGEPRALLLRGEAGIGKTRLIRELVDAARSREGEPPPVVALSQCVDLGPIGVPFAPVRRLLQDIHRIVGPEEFAEAVGSTGVLDTLSTLVPELASDGAGSESRQDRYVAESIERVLEQLSRRRRLVLVIEDLHWVDASTLALLRTLSMTLRAEHLLLVMTYRTEDVTTGHRLREAVAEFERSRRIEIVAVGRLDRTEVNSLAMEILGRDPSVGELETLMARSDGVPFFVEELLGIPESELPPTLRDVVLARYERLPPVAQRVAGAVAVGGSEVEHDLLAAVWPASDEELDAGIRQAVATNLLVTTADGYQFRHALFREAVYDVLLPRERMDLHRAYAAELRRRVEHGDDTCAAPEAEHWLAAKEAGAAFDASVIALRHASDRLAPGTAARIGERLLELWPAVPDASARAGTDRLALSARIAHDYRSAHHVRDCLRVVTDALSEAGPDDIARVPLLLTELEAARETERRAEIAGNVDEILRLLEDRHTPEAERWRAAALSWAAVFATGTDKLGAARRAVEAATAVGDPSIRAFALTISARAWSARGDLLRALQDLDEGMPLAAGSSDDSLAAANESVCYRLQVGDLDGAIQVGLGAFARASDAGRERAGAHVLSNTAEAIIATGRLDEGLEAARRSIELTRGDSVQVVLNAIQIQGIGLVWDDRLDECDLLLATEGESASSAALDLQWVGVWNMLLIDLAVAKARREQAAPRLRALTAMMPLVMVLEDESVRDQPGEVDVLLVSGARLLAEIRLAGGDPRPETAAAIAELVTHMPHPDRGAPLMAMVVALLATAEEGDDEVQAWRRAVEVAERGCVPKRALHESRFRLAEALLRAGGDSDEPHRLLTQVTQQAPADGVSLVASWARTLRRRGEAGSPVDLTAREKEVLGLVAQGRTNGEIASELFISPKTVSVHVSSILAKTGAANRTEAASMHSSSGT
ncbi:helix-turn-helix transcriptional regulator [Demequina zhanjiangensis]|uniref:AAA family ATPase n=1 Tax=Demequina zhanjiangensis TaxID=3051659 RepID=A0ABT8G169_9MICO|nr:AAA family ATPase [Demequina sp. SYSU T00b26]MDN4472704.1 AAA family ATPase [Demequina sp. SYSU T00b26]